jgi:excisionase family DNA binding protein
MPRNLRVTGGEKVGKGQRRKLDRQQLPVHSIHEVAQYLGRCDRTIRNAIAAGKLKVLPWGGSRVIHQRELERVCREGF